MKKYLFSITLIIIFSLALYPIFILESLALENPIIHPRKQWAHSPQLELVECKENLLLLQKHNGFPSCVSATTYLSLIDRGYGSFDSEILKKRPTMMDILIEKMVSDQNMMNHWHEMMINDKPLLNKTMKNWISSMKDNPDLLSNVMGPFTSDPVLREKMITQMKQNDNLMKDLQNHSRWMNSVHDDTMKKDHSPEMQMNSNTNNEINQPTCSWCPKLEKRVINHHSMNFSHSDWMMDMMHQIWINENYRGTMHNFMLKNPTHMAHMAEDFMSPILAHMMDDPEIRKLMIEMMLEHQEFMKSIRHTN